MRGRVESSGIRAGKLLEAITALQQRCLARPFATADGVLPPSHFIATHGVLLGLSVNK